MSNLARRDKRWVVDNLGPIAGDYSGQEYSSTDDLRSCFYRRGQRLARLYPQVVISVQDCIEAAQEAARFLEGGDVADKSGIRLTRDLNVAINRLNEHHGLCIDCQEFDRFKDCLIDLERQMRVVIGHPHPSTQERIGAHLLQSAIRE